MFLKYSMLFKKPLNYTKSSLFKQTEKSEYILEISYQTCYKQIKKLTFNGKFSYLGEKKFTYFEQSST